MSPVPISRRWAIDVRGRSRMPSGRRRRARVWAGGVLFEVMLALALFVGAASFTLAAARSVFSSLDQMRRRQEAIDLARSKLAELQTGLITISDLRGQHVDSVSSSKGADVDRPSQSAGAGGWILEAKTTRTVFTGLSLVELTVREDVAPDVPQAVSFTLRQLMPLRESNFGEAENEG